MLMKGGRDDDGDDDDDVCDESVWKWECLFVRQCYDPVHTH